jgi:hypothetical protein
MNQSGNALTATMTATFHPKRADTTNDRSVKREFGSLGVKDKSGQAAQRTKIFGEKDHAKCVYSEGNDF